MKDVTSFRTRAARLALAGAALAGAALFAPAAGAAVITKDVSDDPLSVVPYDLGGVYMNLGTGAMSTDYNDPAVAGWDINLFFKDPADSSRPVTFDIYSAAGTGVVVKGIIPGSLPWDQSVGQTIGPGAYVKDGLTKAGWDNTVTVRYVGFEFYNEATKAEDFGYMAVENIGDLPAAGSVKILGWAYDDTGGAITVNPLGGVSAVPEPASFVLLGAGLLSVALFGKRRRRA